MSSVMSYVVYTMPNCPDCKNAKAFLEREGINFKEVTDFTREELIELVGPVRTLPQIIQVRVDKQTHEMTKYHVGGYKDLVKLFAGDHPGPRKL